MKVATYKSVRPSFSDSGSYIPVMLETSTATLKDIARGFPNVSLNVGFNSTVSNRCTKENVVESFVFTTFMKENLILFLILFCVLMLVVMRCVKCCMSKSGVKNVNTSTPPKVCNLSFSTQK